MVWGDDMEKGEKKHSPPDSTDRKKQTHLRCERQRREAINNGYQELKELLPSSLSSMACKTTNAAILFRACDYIQQLRKQQQDGEVEMTRLKAQLSALQVIAYQYEQLSADSSPSMTTSSPAALQSSMLRQLLDACFESFCQRVNTNDYSSIARTLLTWLESVDFEGTANLMSATAYKKPRHS